MGRVADATVLAPRRSDDAIAFATARSSNNGDGAVPPNPAPCKVMSQDGHGHRAVARLIRRLSSSP